MDMITKNERAFLYLLSQTKSLTKMTMVKLMFLASKERSLYDFVPYQVRAVFIPVIPGHAPP